MRIRRTLVASTGRVKERSALLRFCAGALLLAALLVCIVSMALADTVTFPDVPATHPYYSAINELASQSIISGFADGRFGPSEAVTRQQFAKMIVLTGRYPVSEANVCHFTDVQSSGPASLYPDNYVAVCAARGITAGKTATTFDPTGNITRYQVVSMVVRAADDLRPGLLTSPPAGFTATGGWGNDAVHGANAARAEYHGLLAGLDLGVLSPYSNMTRGEVAQVLHNLLGALPTTSTSQGSSSTTSTSQGSSSTTSSSSTSSTTSSSTTTTTTAPAQFALLTTTPGGGGTIARNPNQATYNAGVSVVLTAVPAAGYRFAGWGGAAAGATNPLTVVMDSNKAVSATFSFAYEDLGGIPAPPAVCSDGRRGLRVFWIDASGRLNQKNYDPDTGWTSSALMNVDLKPGSTPAVVAWSFRGGPRLDVFARSADNHLMWRYFTTTWSDWEDLSYVETGGAIAHEVLSDPTACAPGGSGLSGHLRVFFRTTGGALGKYEMTLDDDGSWGGSGFAKWQDVSAQFKAGSDPAMVSYAPGIIDLFTRGSNNHLWHRSCVGFLWSDWQDLGGTLTTSPAAAVTGSRELAVFAGGPGNTLWYAYLGSTGWVATQQVSSAVITSDPAAACPKQGRVDVFVRGGSSRLWHTWWEGSGWKP